mgnify:FL=1
MLTDFRLKVFETVARRLSFTRASEELFITQPAVTRHIRELEQQFGCRLFKRSGRKVALTEEGEKLLVPARRILKEYALLNEVMAGDSSRLQGYLHMGASTTLTQYVLPPILALFHRMYPDIRVDLMDGNTECIEAAVVGEVVQLGLIEGSGEHADLHYRSFIRDEIVLVTAASNPALVRREWTVEQLRELPLVLREAGSGTQAVVRKALGEKGILENELSVSMRLGSSESIKRYLSKSNACAFLSLFAVREELERGALVRVPVRNFDVTRVFRFVTPHGEQSRLSGLMIRFCLDYYNKM